MANFKKARLTLDDAETLALQGLTFLASDPERMSRFFALTGLGPGELRSWAESPRLQVAVFDHLMGDESLLLVFAAEAGIAPGDAVAARQLLVALAAKEAGGLPDEY
jgi:Protein of unknown function (DUF3572)